MTDDAPPDRTGTESRPRTGVSLAHGVGPALPGTLVAQSLEGGITVGPRPGRIVLFGRQAENVHVCVGADDLRVSRRHGILSCGQLGWSVRNVGRQRIRLPSGEIHTNAEPVPLAEGYTPLFVQGTGHREHLLELYVVGADGARPVPRHDHDTHHPTTWPLSDQERLALIVLAQRYLRHEPNPQPLTREDAARVLESLDPGGGWTHRIVEHRVSDVRKRLSRRGVPGLVREEVQAPIGNQLNANLIRELLTSGTLVPTDLTLLDEWADG